MWFKWIYGNVGIIGDQAGQLLESGKILDGKVESDLDRKFGAPRW
jgi:hypothetical protein